MMAAGRAGPPTARARPCGGTPPATPNGRSTRMTRPHFAVVAALAALLAPAARASAQQPVDQRRVDSLAAEVRALKARLDSLRAQVGGGRAGAAPAKRDTTAIDEPAARRAAAAAAAGTDTGRMRSDTATPTKLVGR